MESFKEFNHKNVLISANYLHICQKSDDNFTDCVKSSIGLFQSALINGIPNINISSIDPLEIGELFRSNKSRRGTNIKVQNIHFLGISKFKVEKLQ